MSKKQKIIGIFVCFLSVVAKAENCRLVPSDFDDNRIYIKVQSGKESFRFYSDSGGGLYPFVYSDVAKKLGMKIEENISDGDFQFGRSTLPLELEKQNIPISPDWKGKVRVFTYVKDGKDEASQSRFFLGDGFFGATFFKGRLWRFNYQKMNLAYCESIEQVSDYSSIPIYFKKFEGNPTSYQPRIQIEVSGSKISVLFDTGATSLYSAEAIQLIQSKRPFTASSFVRESVAANWIKQNPHWRVIHGGEKFAGGGDLVEVPQVAIAGINVGPVWFASRKDEIYDKYSKEIMDGNIDGAIGGNLLKHFDLYADYQKEILYLKVF